jgi:hypothetical protein
MSHHYSSYLWAATYNYWFNGGRLELLTLWTTACGNAKIKYYANNASLTPFHKKWPML